LTLARLAVQIPKKIYEELLASGRRALGRFSASAQIAALDEKQESRLI
jgi:hypothetical protein